jgi:2-methylcitrate dehydratase
MHAVDAVTESIASYAVGLTYADITPDALLGIKRRLVDSVGCALGGLHSEPVSIARTLAGATQGTPSARVWFSGERTTVEMAAFANALMVRFLDFNDTYMVREGGHPSDVIAPTLAVADALALSGRDALVALVAAFETSASLSEVERLAPSNLDHSLHVAVGSAVGASRAMGLDHAQTAHAIAMTVTSNTSLKIARDGHLSMWKAGSAANAAKNGVFNARLASLGMTGPDDPFLAPSGLAGVIDEPTTVPSFDGFHTHRSSLKFFPAQYNAQAAIWAALELRAQLGGVTPDEISVTSYGHAVRSSADPTKWDVHDRETADHSIPYLVAIALVDGEVTPAQFTDERIADPVVQALIARISVSEDVEMTAAFPGAQPARIIATAGGKSYTVYIPNSKGHEKNPLSDAEVEGKFRSLARGVLPDARVDDVLARLWAFDEEPDVRAWAESLDI